MKISYRTRLRNYTEGPEIGYLAEDTQGRIPKPEERSSRPASWNSTTFPIFLVLVFRFFCLVVCFYFGLGFLGFFYMFLLILTKNRNLPCHESKLVVCNLVF